MQPCASRGDRPECVPFLGLDFTPLTIDDQPELEPFLARHPHALSGYTFATFVAWDHVFHYCWAFTGSGALLVAFRFAPDGPLHLMQPIGPLDAATAAAIVAAGRRLDKPLAIVGVDRAFLDAQPGFVSEFVVSEEPENANYIYRASDLAELKGRRYAKKRNLIAQAEQSYAWSVEPMTPERVDDAFEVMRLMAEDEPPVSESMEQDNEALRRTLRDFGRLRQEGILVRVDAAPAGFALFERQTPETLVIHFERARRDVKGLYQLVNRAAAEAAVRGGFAFINREEDLGDPGLRQAKASYDPIRLEMAYRLPLRIGDSSR
jgi:hypothetical protein